MIRFFIFMPTVPFLMFAVFCQILLSNLGLGGWGNRWAGAGGTRAAHRPARDPRGPGLGPGRLPLSILYLFHMSCISWIYLEYICMHLGYMFGICLSMCWLFFVYL